METAEGTLMAEDNQNLLTNGNEETKEESVSLNATNLNLDEHYSNIGGNREKIIESLVDDVDGEIVEKKRWVLFGLPWTFTTYSINKDVLTIDTGLLNKQENDCYMYKIVDVKLTSTIFQRMSALGDVICYTGDTTNPEIVLKNIKNAKDVKNYILKNSEVARLKRRTLNMLNIGAADMTDADMT